ncbi:alpha beta-hydrolase protein [Penicillium subrubescens]|nr:alpha beta-hydrolase protein [Penicillium subrubescens]KAJ5906419.1 alpha beta-hydrolase protein [Penicillium subrubescens]
MISPDLKLGSHQFTAPNGITFNYLIRGQGPLVIFQSVGWGPSMHLYSNTMRELEEDFTVLYFEARGSGGTSRPSADEMSSRAMGSDLDSLRIHLRQEKLRLLGHSNGGAIVLAYAEDFPDKVEKLVLINSELQGFSSDNSATYAAARQDHPVYGPALKNMFKLIQQPPSTDDEFAEALHSVLPYYMHDTNKTSLLADALEGGSLSVWNFLNQRRCDNELKFSAVEGLSKVQAQTLVINGRVDGVCSEAAAREVASGLGSKAELVLIEEAGHVPWLEKPVEFFSAVRKFLCS